MARAKSGAVRIGYDDLGQGEPALLCMPGWCVNRTVFEDLVPLCCQHRRTLVLDWRSHGESDPSEEDFGADGLVEDALAVVEASGAEQIVPVALAHAGWVAIELRRRLGKRIPKLVLVDWIVSMAPRGFFEALQGLQSADHWRETVEYLLAVWLHGTENPKLIRFVREGIGAYGFEMWERAAREISAAYAESSSPLHALSLLKPPVPTLHLYAQPDDPGYLSAQESFAATHPWFHVGKLDAQSHFSILEIPGELASAIDQFAG